VLLALGFDGPERDGGLMEQLALRPDPRGNFARGTDFSAGPEGYSWPATRDAELH
jgi:glutamate synthase (NADPH/NADH) small chain